MGAGKTMYLRANHAYYLYSLVPSLLEGSAITVPILIRLSDFQHIRQPEEIYRQIILTLLSELCGLPLQFADASRLAGWHRGLQAVPSDLLVGPRRDVLRSIQRLRSEEYVERVSTSLGLKGGAKHSLFEVAAEYKSEGFLELRGKDTVGIADIRDAYERLIAPLGGSLLILIDEAGALDKSFFSSSERTSLFETFMNQLRTAPYIRTKVAVYPHSYSDVLAETRYGDVISLSENVESPDGYVRFRRRALALIERYIALASDGESSREEVFDIRLDASAYGDCLEQIIYASEGNARRLVRLLDQSMSEAYMAFPADPIVTAEHVRRALEGHSAAAEANYPESERSFLDSLATVCRGRGTYRFQFPYRSPVLSKYVTRSEEHNLLRISDPGAGRRGTTYAFDYAYCVAHDIPTHLIRGTEKVDRTRSQEHGALVTRAAQISEELVNQAHIPKEDGRITFLKVEDKVGFIDTEDGRSYFFRYGHLIEGDQGRALTMGQRVRFYPAPFGDGQYAFLIELT